MKNKIKNNVKVIIITYWEITIKSFYNTYNRKKILDKKNIHVFKLFEDEYEFLLVEKNNAIELPPIYNILCFIT